MKVVKMTCPVDESGSCHETLSLSHVGLTSVLHYPNNHILIFKDNYDRKGSVKKSAWSIKEEDKLDSYVKIKMQQIYQREFV